MAFPARVSILKVELDFKSRNGIIHEVLNEVMSTIVGKTKIDRKKEENKSDNPAVSNILMSGWK